MLKAFVMLIRVLWPFLKENVLQDKTFKEWLRRHRVTCFWILFQLIMLATVFYLADRVNEHRAAAQEYRHKLDLIELEKRGLSDRLLETQTELKNSRAKVADLESLLPNASTARTRLPGEGCAFFQAPANPSLPVLVPLSETEMRHKEAAVAKLAQHVVQVRGYARDINKNWEEAYARYLAGCSPHLPGPVAEE